MRVADAILSRLVRVLGLVKDSRWAIYRAFMAFSRLFFRLHNRIEVHGRARVPDGGAILYLNHRGEQDVVIFLSAFQRPVGVFTDVGNGWLADWMERALGFVPRRGVAPVMVEKMVRALWTKNRYFAIWPEGTASPDGAVMHGFSGIARVYAVLNHDRDRVPLVPVLMRGNESYWWGERRKPKKILVEFLEPFFLPREWLRPPEAGGKTAREIIDHLMLVLARVLGQDHLQPNPLLERRRRARGKPWWS